MSIWRLFKPKADPPNTTPSAPQPDVESLLLQGWRSLPRLASMLFEENHDLSRAAAEAAAELLDQIPITRYGQLDQSIRSTFVLGYVGPEALLRLPIYGDTRWVVFGLASCSPNGHAREAAIRELDRVNSGRELPFLLVRANDWVPQVRRAAIDAIVRRITSAYATRLVRVLPLVRRLTDVRRTDHTELVEQVERFLRTEAREALIAGLHSPDRWVRRGCVQCLVSVADDRVVNEFVGVIEEQDPIAACCAADCVWDRATDEQLVVVLQRIDTIRHARIRVGLLETGRSRGIAATSGALQHALFDPTTSVRETARYYLRSDQQVASGEIYVRALSQATGKRLLGALYGLSDVGRSEHATLVEQFIGGDYRPRIRLAALGVFARLSKSPGTVLSRALGDAHAGVSGLAAQLLVTRRVAIAELELAELLKNPIDHVRRNALLVLLRQGKWTGLRWALTALERPEFTDVEFIATHLHTWEARFNRSFARPREGELTAILDSLERLSDRVPDQSAAFIRFVIQREMA